MGPKMQPTSFKSTKTFSFALGEDEVKVHIMDSERHGIWWLLEVNGDKSLPYNFYEGLLSHKEWFVATPYWEGTLPAWIPFRIVPANIHFRHLEE